MRAVLTNKPHYECKIYSAITVPNFKHKRIFKIFLFYFLINDWYLKICF